MKGLYMILLGAVSFTAMGQTNNNFPVTGSATIYDYSPMLFLKRNTNEGGFVQGIQTQLLDGTNNWFYGAVHEGKWTVGKGDYQNEKLTVLNNGNVGVGTDNPLANLHVNGIMRWGGHNANYLYSGQDGIGAYFEQVGNDADKSSIRFQTSVLGTGQNYSVFSIDPEKGFSFFSWGNGNSDVGIGTSDTKGYKLAVNGKVRAHEIKVETANWPDYVFAKDYKLPTLQETEKHIKDKGHLPGIPSAGEVKANGIDLGEMNAKLLKKIEELTLYLIEKDKQNQMLNKRLQKLEGDNARILKQLKHEK
ncbi:hypothetical protein [Pedobacter africanus]|uniref:Uncharacterized protein n=1 Tax=Pedobacter africanus TaxID=151894 RepID=A0A1W2EF41_9SPHI|nr:hypothetical protein [Pedobacter africanus]SMD08285.1 hypothetical protein SAMN04488524_4745 [Pedobacter africanus]